MPSPGSILIHASRSSPVAPCRSHPGRMRGRSSRAVGDSSPSGEGVRCWQPTHPWCCSGSCTSPRALSGSARCSWWCWGCRRRDGSEMAGRVLIGTSSWTGPTLVKSGHFYPPDAKSAEGRLRFYASKFPIVEVDSTYYFPPSESNSVLWIERTPPDFTFNIKAYSLLTNHPTKRDSLYKELQDHAPADKKNVYREQLPDEAVDEVWQRFRDALMPLHSAGKLGAVLC